MSDHARVWLASDPPTAAFGAAPQSDQARWEALGRAEPSKNGADFATHFAEHFDLIAEHGLRAIRLTIDWARVEPFPGRIDREEVERLDEIYHAAGERNLAVWTTLHHGSLPGWFSEDTNGFATTEGPSLHWSRHVEHMAERFDPLTHLWAPVDDPLGWAVRGYHLGTHPPGKRILPTDNGNLIDALAGSLDATFEAHRILASGDKPIAGIFRPPVIRAGTNPDGNTFDAERQFWDDALWGSWMHAISDGELAWPGRARLARPDMADAFDLLIVASSGGMVAGADGHLAPMDHRPKNGLVETLHRTTEHLPDHQLIVGGFGAGNGDEASQMRWIQSQLVQLQQVIDDGLPICGVILEPLLDGYDPSVGAWVENGLFTRDREAKPGFQMITAQW